jgi:hypothetical protein
MAPKSKAKAIEPSLRAKLSAVFLEALERDFQENGVEVIKGLREKHLDRYAELVGRTIAQTEPKEDTWDQTKSVQDIARKLLREVGTDEYAMSDDIVEQAVQANDEFIARLVEIKDRAQN